MVEAPAGRPAPPRSRPGRPFRHRPRPPASARAAARSLRRRGRAGAGPAPAELRVDRPPDLGQRHALAGEALGLQGDGDAGAAARAVGVVRRPSVGRERRDEAVQVVGVPLALAARSSTARRAAGPGARAKRYASAAGSPRAYGGSGPLAGRRAPAGAAPSVAEAAAPPHPVARTRPPTATASTDRRLICIVLPPRRAGVPAPGSPGTPSGRGWRRNARRVGENPDAAPRPDARTGGEEPPPCCTVPAAWGRGAAAVPLSPTPARRPGGGGGGGSEAGSWPSRAGRSGQSPRPSA